jgi:hypothetical protein
MPKSNDSVLGTQHKSPPATMPAGSISITTEVSTIAIPSNYRVATTKQNEGTVTLRYTPLQPKIESTGTGT